MSATRAKNTYVIRVTCDQTLPTSITLLVGVHVPEVSAVRIPANDKLNLCLVANDRTVTVDSRLSKVSIVMVPVTPRPGRQDASSAALT
jgi:hypothetical protein